MIKIIFIFKFGFYSTIYTELTSWIVCYFTQFFKEHVWNIFTLQWNLHELGDVRSITSARKSEHSRVEFKPGKPPALKQCGAKLLMMRGVGARNNLRYLLKDRLVNRNLTKHQPFTTYLYSKTCDVGTLKHSPYMGAWMGVNRIANWGPYLLLNNESELYFLMISE